MFTLRVTLKLLLQMEAKSYWWEILIIQDIREFIDSFVVWEFSFVYCLANSKAHNLVAYAAFSQFVVGLWVILKI